MPVKAVFFDAGGTLIHAWPSVGEVYARVAAALGHRADPAAFDEKLGPHWRAYQARAAREGLPRATSDAEDAAMWRTVTQAVCAEIPALHGMDFDRWFDGVSSAFATGACWRRFPEVDDVLDACRRRGLRCGIVSNWSSRLLRILDEQELTGHLDFIHVSAIEGCRKPDLAFFDRALAKAGVRASEALHVGDTYDEDAAGAVAAGLTGVHLDRKGTGSPANGCPVVRDLRGILALL